MKIIARIENDFTEKFGIPRQSGLVETESRIIFQREYRVAEAVRGLDDFTHIWLIWLFSETATDSFSPTVRPPRLGGNRRMGVFATRSPFRPNNIGLSCVRLVRVDRDGPDAPRLIVTGADLMNGTPILDIKPYLAYTDSHPEAASGFALTEKGNILSVDFPPALLEMIPENKRQVMIDLLSQDPRPQYKRLKEESYAISFGGFNVSFTAQGDRLTVTAVEKIQHCI